MEMSFAKDHDVLKQLQANERRTRSELSVLRGELAAAAAKELHYTGLMREQEERLLLRLVLSISVITVIILNTR